MRATTIKSKFLQCLLALTLVTGLMAAPLTQSAYGEGVDQANGQQTPETITTDELVPLTNSSDRISLVDVGASAVTEVDEPDATITDKAIDETVEPDKAAGEVQEGKSDSVDSALSDEAEDEEVTPVGAATKAPTSEDVSTLAKAQSDNADEANDADAAEPDDAEEDADDSEAEVIAYADGTTDVVLQGITFSGVGISASDFEVAGNKVSIKTSKQLTITTGGTPQAPTQVAAGIVVPNGVEAHVVFAGVNLVVDAPFDIQTGGIAHIVLADGTLNNFDSYRNSNGNLQFPGIHCGTGAAIYIDDSVPNVDVNGNAIVPVDGMIPVGTTFVANDGTTRTAKPTADNYLTLLDSKNPGTLQVHGGGQSAGLGGKYSEDGGNMTFNGGNIIVTNGAGRSVGSANADGDIFGPGIGGGGNAAGTSPSEWITVNGGNINATAAYHGAGIGGGWNQATKTVPAGVTKSLHPHGTGNIRINGGYILSNGGEDGNGFGRGCYGQTQVCDNSDYTIYITGGTMIPKGGTNLGNYSQDIGGAGTGYSPDKIANTDHAAHMIITGGSIFVGKSGNRFRFDGTAYGKAVIEDGKIKPAGSDVTIVTIDLSKEDGIESNLITKWQLYIDGMQYQYGAPSMLDNGLLYLWLPSEYSQTADKPGSKIEVRLSYLKDVNGELREITLSPLYIDELGNDGASGLRRYVDLDLERMKEMINEGHSVPAYETLRQFFSNLDKFYDGNPLPTFDVVKNPISTLGLEDDPLENKILNDPTALKTSFQTIGDDPDKPLAAGATMPTNSGYQKIEITSSQYVNDSASYWGHRMIGDATISPVTSQSNCELTDETAIEVDGAKYTFPTWVQDSGNHNVVTNNHLVVPVDVTSYLLPFGQSYADKSTMTKATCAAPTGILQLYMDGVKVPERFGGTITVSGFDEDGKGLNDDSTLSNVYLRHDAKNGNREHTMAYFDMNRMQINAFFNTAEYREALENGTIDLGEGNEHKVLVTYTSVVLPEDRLTERNPATDEGVAAASDMLAVQADGSAVQNSSAGVDVDPRYTDYAYVNYYESQTQTMPVRIQMADPDLTVYNAKGGVLLDDKAKPILNEDGDNVEAPEWTGSVSAVADEPGDDYKASYVAFNDKDEREILHKNYRYEISDFRTGEDGVVKDDFMNLLVTTNTIGSVTLTSSNPGVISFDPSVIRNSYTADEVMYKTPVKAYVRSAGVTTITVKAAQSGSFNEAVREFTVYIYPDLDTPPVLKVTETATNTSRSDGTIRPNDSIVYTANMKNTVADTALFNPELSITIPADVTLNKLMAVDPEGNVIELDVTPVVNPDGSRTYVYEPDCVLYGGSTYKLIAETTVNADTALKAARGEKLNFKSESRVNGVYGINPDAFVWDTRIDTTEGVKVAEAVDSADPTRKRPEVKPGIIEEILGGDIVEIDPGTKPPTTEVVVGDVTPGSPFDTATEDTDDPTPTPKPIKPGDKITSFGDVDDPKTPEDIAEEVKKRIEEVLKENENKPDGEKITEIEIPVTVERTDPQHPDQPPQTIEVIVTVPITDDMLEDPTPDTPENPDDPTNPDDPSDPVTPQPQDDPDDYDLKFLPTDPEVPSHKKDPVDPDNPDNPDDPENPDNPDDPDDPENPDDPDNPTPPAYDVTVEKTVKNVTDGFANRKNTYALVGDILEYTITVDNKKLGSAWLAAKIYDPLPVGVEYVPGSAKIFNGLTGVTTSITPEIDVASAESRSIGFKIGDIYGGAEPTTITFKVKVTPEAVVDGTPVPANFAYAAGTKPSETITYPPGVDPENYKPGIDEPVDIELPDPTPGPYDPEDDKDLWEEITDPENPDAGPKTEQPAQPDGTSHTDPDHKKFTTTKTATILADSEDNTIYVGDEIAYEVVFANNDEPWTAWYNVTVYDKLPEGLLPVAGSFKMIAPGTEEEVALEDAVFDAETGDIAIYVGRVLGGESVRIKFTCVVTEAAIDGDIGNVAVVIGTDPSATDPSVLDGDPSATPGLGKRPATPEGGWQQYVEDTEGSSHSTVAYPNGIENLQIKYRDGQGSDNNGTNAGGDNGVNALHKLPGTDGGNGDDDAMLKLLAKTGDAVSLTFVGGVAALALLGLGIAWRRRRLS